MAQVTVTIAGREHLLPPGDSLRLPLARGAALDAEWRTLPPRSSAGRELGLMLRGVMHEDQPRGELRRGIDLWTLGRSYVAPVVTNATEGPLRVTLRDAGGLAVDCDCVVPAGGTTYIGYRDPGQLAAVEFTDPAGRTARVIDLAARADRATGAVSIQLTPADFAPQRASGGPMPAPATVTLPLPRTEPITDSLPLFAPDTVPAVRADSVHRPKPLQNDPLRGTVTNH